jgi:hypothetical protein
MKVNYFNLLAVGVITAVLFLNVNVVLSSKASANFKFSGTHDVHALDDASGSGDGSGSGGAGGFGRKEGPLFTVTCGGTLIKVETYTYKNAGGQVSGTFTYNNGTLVASSGTRTGSVTITSYEIVQGGHDTDGWNCVPGAWYETCTPCPTPCIGCND